ncbi:hypothetical protein HZC53_05650 [Candidatus Uhrbacteria bacterium]|nr:hypothetical protein [Candidatus Uhrbacteria bacterium]
MNKLFLSLAILPLIGAGCWFSPKTQAPEPSLQVPGQEQPSAAVPGLPTVAQPEVPGAPEVMSNQNSYIEVKDQPAGIEVKLDYVLLQKQGFVVIHEDKDGMPGAIIGSSELLNAGEMRETFVKVKTQTGKTYWAMLHADNGDKKFDAKTDAPVKDSKDAIVMAKFKAL